MGPRHTYDFDFDHDVYHDVYHHDTVMSTLRRTQNQDIVLMPSDRRFIEFCRRIKWAKVELLIKDGQPIMATVIRHDFRFDIEPEP